MTDINKIVRAWLLQSGSGIATQLNGARVYGGNLPEGFTPADGGGIVLSVDGGQGHSEIAAIQKVRVVVRCWRGPDEYDKARADYRAVYDWIHAKNNISFGADGTILSSVEAVTGQDVVDPDTGWATVVAFYQITARD